MSADSAAITYAKEVYAACATVGYTSSTVARLKRLLDEDGDVDEIVAAAQAAQGESIDWAGRNERE